jgi:cytochrome c551/c552
MGMQDGLRPMGLHFGETTHRVEFEYMAQQRLRLFRTGAVHKDRLETELQLLAALVPADRMMEALQPMLSPWRELLEQETALKVLASLISEKVGEWIVEALPGLTPVVREQAVTALLSRTDRIAKLLDAIEAKKITPAQLSVAAKATLGRQKTPALAERIAKLIGDGSSANRKEVIERYLTAMLGSDAGTPARNESVVAGKSARITGDATRGSKIYETACMVCHKFADKGNDVGPQYRSVIFHHDDGQKHEAETFIAELSAKKVFPAPIVTEIAPAAHFWVAEDYHQEYFVQHGHEPYCQYVVAPKVAKFRKVFADRRKSA